MNGGVIYEYDPVAHQYLTVFNFDVIAKGTVLPLGTLKEASNGKFYGLTVYGGAYQSGSLFEFDPSSKKLSVKADCSTKTGSSLFGTLCAIDA